MNIEMISHLKQLALCPSRRKPALTQSHSELHQHLNSRNAAFNWTQFRFDFFKCTNILTLKLNWMAVCSQINSLFKIL